MGRPAKIGRARRPACKDSKKWIVNSKKLNQAAFSLLTSNYSLLTMSLSAEEGEDEVNQGAILRALLGTEDFFYLEELNT